MTKDEARAALAVSWRFDRIGEFIALREVKLIEAVRAQETTRPPNLPGSFSYTSAQAQRSS